MPHTEFSGQLANDGLVPAGEATDAKVLNGFDQMRIKQDEAVESVVYRDGFNRRQVESYLGESADNFVSLEVVQQTPMFVHVARYIAEHGTAISRFDLHSVTFDSDELDPADEDTGGCEGDNDTDNHKLHFGLGAGMCRLSFRERTVFAVKNYVGNPEGAYWKMTMHLFVHKDGLSGSQVMPFFDAFCKRCLFWSKKKDQVDGSFQLYRYKLDGGIHGYWESEGVRKGRPIDSIIMDNGVPERLESDLNRFLKAETKRFYYKHGIPYRRSYLFYGPPGSGKSSMIKAIATRHKKSVSFLTLAHPQMTDQALADAVRSLEKDTILVLEDVDCLFAASALGKDDRTLENNVQLTFSGVLNVLDGLSASWCATITILTTNHYEKLNPALIRAGRVDRKFNFPKPSKTQTEKFFRSFYPDSSIALAQAFAEKVESFATAQADANALSIAVLQQLMIFFMDASAEEVVDSCGEFFAEFFPVDAERPVSSIYT
mmetsp:Transcript_5354/g.14345  ORF Transcript_5354/g.14345 Transcript_5354/m.14345 type:complete len:487 (+) Transcript_5354:73-1533(+)|eukprot:CAMPEP_0185842576 /NCGR_PEP_ID=MMETSP1353-20130828/18475_1 /TAXON_ID=1077150 /ORGANISM="Erythrolobus australicus, Strain CCMP3124" /LENGTH=486 /DNA_ID=CAMNT_0028542079 /DNA_START=43 /DNA_END=1503 /DNA_ORIENTATION=+